MLEARTQDNKSFRIFCMKDPDYVMKIMASWFTLDELEGVKTGIEFVESSGKKYTKRFTYRKIFGIHFSYRHQVGDHKKIIHAENALDRTWGTKFWPDCNFA